MIFAVILQTTFAWLQSLLLLADKEVLTSIYHRDVCSVYKVPFWKDITPLLNKGPQTTNGWIFPVFAGFGKKKNQHLMFNSESLKVIENDSLCKINLFREVSIHVYVFNLDKTINVIFMQMEQEYSGLNLLPFKILKFKASRLVSLCWWRKLQSSLCTYVKLLSHHASVCRIQLYCKDT